MSELSEDQIDAYVEKVRQTIERHGWAIQAIPDADPYPFQYTVGLFPVVGYELIVIGLPHQVGGTLLNDLAGAVVREPDPDGYYYDQQILRGLLVDSYASMLIRAIDTLHYITVPRRLWPIEGPVPAFQLVYPDDEHRWPWDPGSKVAGVPLLGKHP